VTHRNLAVVPAPRAAEEPLSDLRARARQLADGALDGEACAAVVRQLERDVALSPGPELGALLQELLDDPRLRLRSLPGGQPLRLRLLQAQQALGFPWALEVAPEDLALLPRAEVPRYGGRALLFLASAFSFLWNGALARLVDGETLVTGHAPWEQAPLFFLLAAIHAGATLLLALSFRPRWLLQASAWLGLLAPLFALQATLRSGFDQLGGNLLVAAVAVLPTTLTALGALRLSRDARE